MLKLRKLDSTKPPCERETYLKSNWHFMFKKRMAGGDTKRRKRIRLENEQTETDEVPLKTESKVPKVENASKIASLPKERDDNELQSEEDDGDERKFTLSVNDDATKVDRLTVELKNSDGTGSKRIGQPSHVKTTLLMDYQPDICKDYQQTGYCGYGDSCKFLHSRDSFRGGWQLNQEWKIDSNEGTEQIGNSTDLSEVPPKCAICGNEYKSPVLTTCGHYFCSSCFTKRVRKDSKCLICRKDTHGVAKVANNLKKLLKTKQSS